ncbi:MAG TPA: restriction endonuclease subunit S [Edaphocola sp.]|nr:restriction endonuclease subunit S [Edaphocola sp.]
MRFPGFEGEWERKKLGEIATFSKGKGISKNDIEENGMTECIRYGELYTHYGEVIDEIRSKTNINISNLILSEANDVIIPASGETAIDIATASCVLKSDVVLGGDLNIIKSSNNGVFLSYYLNNKKKMKIASLAQGSSVVHLYSSQLASITLNLPKLEEQNKIAFLLSLLDSRIHTQNKIIEQLDSLIKGLVKHIFTQRLKFRNNNEKDFPKWEKKNLGEICEKKSSNISANKIEENFGKYIIYGASGVLKNVDFYEEENDYISIVKDGAGVGRLFYCKGKSSVLGTMDIIKPLVNTNTHFLFYLLSNIDFKKYVTGSTIPHIYFKDYKNENLGIPSIKEQTAIAQFLSSIDQKLQTEKDVLEQLEKQKKFLLQNLFV